MPAVVADSSPIVYLARLERLALLRSLYSEVFIPSAVWREVAVEGKHLIEGKTLTAAVEEGWIKVESSPVPSIEKNVLLEALDEGESQAISLAVRLKALLIIDEVAGRTAATKLGLKITGTIGVLAQAKRQKLITILRPELDRLLSETNFYCAEELISQTLEDVGEEPL